MDVDRKKVRKDYDEGRITEHEYKNLMVEWSTDHLGRRFHYVCPKCRQAMRHCEEPICEEERVGHHLYEADWAGCDEDIPYKTALRVYQGDDGSRWLLDNSVEEEVKAAVEAVMAKHGCKFDGRVQGTITGEGPKIGFWVNLGDSVPKITANTPG